MEDVIGPSLRWFLDEKPCSSRLDLQGWPENEVPIIIVRRTHLRGSGHMESTRFSQAISRIFLVACGEEEKTSMSGPDPLRTFDGSILDWQSMAPCRSVRRRSHAARQACTLKLFNMRHRRGREERCSSDGWGLRTNGMTRPAHMNRTWGHPNRVKVYNVGELSRRLGRINRKKAQSRIATGLGWKTKEKDAYSHSS